ncbi:MAG: imelysin family protein [Pseudomonadota bacterium]
MKFSYSFRASLALVDRRCLMAVLLALGLTACGGGGGGSTPAPTPPPAPAPAPDPDPDPDPAPAVTLEEATQQLIDNTVLPAIERFLVQATAMNADSVSFCNEGPETIDALQNRWKSLYQEWFTLANYVFGPLDDNIITPEYTFIDGLRLRGTDYTNTVRGEIAADIASAMALDSDYFNGKTFQRVGLLALEVALFETATGEQSPVIANIEAEYMAEPRKCEVLVGLSAQLLSRAQYVSDGWLVMHRNSDQPYRDLFLAGELDDGTEPAAQIIISAQDHLEYLQSRQVASIGAQLSGHVWEALGFMIDNLEELLDGSADTTVSLFDVMTDNGESAAVDEVRESIADIREAIQMRDVTMLEIRLGSLDGNFKREIADALDVELGITFSDGD